MIATCGICDAAAQLDEHGRCEECVMDVERRAIHLTCIEDHLADLLNDGMGAGELRVALNLATVGQDGTVGLLARERGWWQVEPRSAFLAGDAPRTRNPLRSLRLFGRLTLEQVADKVGTDPATIRQWENGASIHDEALEQLAEMFAVKPAYLTGATA